MNCLLMAGRLLSIRAKGTMQGCTSYLDFFPQPDPLYAIVFKLYFFVPKFSGVSLPHLEICEIVSSHYSISVMGHLVWCVSILTPRSVESVSVRNTSHFRCFIKYYVIRSPVSISTVQWRQRSPRLEERITRGCHH